jgi:hypothetical protein
VAQSSAMNNLRKNKNKDVTLRQSQYIKFNLPRDWEGFKAWVIYTGDKDLVFCVFFDR